MLENRPSEELVRRAQGRALGCLPSQDPQGVEAQLLSSFAVAPRVLRSSLHAAQQRGPTKSGRYLITDLEELWSWRCSALHDFVSGLQDRPTSLIRVRTGLASAL